MSARPHAAAGHEASLQVTLRIKPRAVTRIKKITPSSEHKVIKALSDPRWKFSTIEGLARRTKLSRAEVEAILDRKRDVVRESLVPDQYGQRLFTLQSRPVTWRERLGLVRLFITKTYR